MDRFGRKFATMLCAIPFVLGWLLISYATDIEMLYAGRIITGIGCGVVSCTSPVSVLFVFFFCFCLFFFYHLQHLFD